MLLTSLVSLCLLAPAADPPKDAFRELIRAIESKGTSDSRLEAVQEWVGKGRSISCDQAKSAVKLFVTYESRKKAAMLLGPCVSDPANFSVVLEELLPSDRDAVRKAVSNFGEMIRAIEAKGSSDSRLEVLQEWVGKGQRMTCTQVKTVLNLLTTYDRKKRAAILVYPCLVDPRNFSVVLEELLPSDRAEVCKLLRID
jgi:hypothetical protein